MASRRNHAVAHHRTKLKLEGMVRLEVKVHREDAELLRDVARALNDPSQQAHARTLLKDRFQTMEGQSLKALLASAPLEGIDLTRQPDIGRDEESWAS